MTFYDDFHLTGICFSHWTIASNPPPKTACKRSAKDCAMIWSELPRFSLENNILLSEHGYLPQCGSD